VIINIGPRQELARRLSQESLFGAELEIHHDYLDR
jgi:hypothetical protein